MHEFIPSVTSIVELLGLIAAGLGALYAVANKMILPLLQAILKHIIEHRAESALRYKTTEARFDNVEARTTALEGGHAELAAKVAAIPPTTPAAPVSAPAPAPMPTAAHVNGLALPA